MYVALLGIVVVGAAFWRAWYLRAFTDRVAARHRFGPNGVIVGAEGFVLERAGAPGILLIHGAGDTPQTLRYLADELYARGFHVSVPLLPGHGRTLREFSHITADDLSAAARAAYDEVRAAHEWTAVIGLSMGGALAVQIAASHHELPALGLIAPYLAMPPKIELAARLSRVWGAVFPVVESSGGTSVLDPEERERSLAYGVFTPAALRALRKTMRRGMDALPRVTAPTVVIQSRADNRISVADAERAFARLGAAEKKLEWITGAAHVITVDYGREQVIASVVAWMEARAPVRA